MMFDEPELSLDADRTDRLGDVLVKHAKEHLFLVAAHDPGLVRKAKRRISLLGGKLTS